MQYKNEQGSMLGIIGSVVQSRYPISNKDPYSLLLTTANCITAFARFLPKFVNFESTCVLYHLYTRFLFF